MANYGLGIDLGTSGLRACVIGPDESIETLESVSWGAPKATELAVTWREALFSAISQIPLSLRRKLAALAIDATSGTILACTADFQPRHSPLLYSDSRAAAEALHIADRFSADHPAASPTSGLAKILWLEQRLAASGDISGHLYLHQADWLGALLSGIAGSDFHNALKSGFTPGETHWPAAISRLGNDLARRLPSVAAPGEPLGRITSRVAQHFNLPRDTLIRRGTTDSIAAFLAASAGIPLEPGVAVTSLGSTLALKMISTVRVEDAATGVYSHWFGNRWLAGGASNAGGQVLRAFFSPPQLSRLSAAIDLTQESPLDYYPLLTPGERFPVCDPELPPRLTPRPLDDGAFLYGLLEGFARIEAQGYRRLQQLGAPVVSTLLSAGGGAGNSAYARIRQRAVERQLGQPVVFVPPASAEAAYGEAAYGSARLARHGAALFY